MRVAPLGFETVSEAQAYNVDKLDLGSTAFVDDLDAFFDLRISTETPNGTTVLSCTGIAGVRWLLRTGGGGSSDFPSNTVTVSTSGNDVHNGVSAPVKTLERAVELIQAMHGGTILAEDFVWASPTAGAGLKMLGASDTGIGGPGWIECNWPMIFEFRGNPERQKQGPGTSYIAPGGGAGEFTEPVLWIAGTQPRIVFNNAQLWTAGAGVFPTVRIGLSSPLAAWNVGTTYSTTTAVTYGGKPYDLITIPSTGNQPDISPSFWQLSRPNSINGDNLGAAQTIFVEFNDCIFYRERADVGPALDLGLTFDDYYHRCLFSKVGYDVVPTDNPEINCAVRMVSTARGGAYLQYFTECQFDSGNIYSSGETGGIIHGCSVEDPIFPLLYCEDSALHGTGNATRWDLNNVDMNDGPFGEDRAAVNNSTGNVYCNRCAKSEGRLIEVNPTSPQIVMTDRFTYGQSAATLLMQHDGAKRGYGPASSKYPNVAWQAPTGATLVAAPDGTNTAFAAGGVIHTMFDETTAPQALVDGDRLIYGIWDRWDTGGFGAGNAVINSGSGPITIFVGGYMINANQEITLGVGEAFRWLGDVPSSFGQWAWQWGWLKVITKGSGKITITASTSTTGALWRPNAQIIPAADTLISDSEAAYLAVLGTGPANFRKFGAPDTILSPTAGTWPMWPGQKLAFFDATLAVWKYLDIDNGAVRVT